MGATSCSAAPWGRTALKATMLLCFLCPGCGHASPALALPARIGVAPPWRSLPLSQADLGPVFSNSSPFAFSQSLLMMAPLRAPSKAAFGASFGHYSVAQLISSPLLPVAPPLFASLLSESVEHDAMGRYAVRALFRWREDAGGGQCITLHAFKATEERRTTCVTQPPLGLCVATLNLPKHWFESDDPASSGQSLALGSKRRWGRKRHRGRRHGRSRGQTGRGAAHVQLYYSSSGFVTNFKTLPLRCMEDKLQQSQKRLFYLGAVAPGAGDRGPGGGAGSAECGDAPGEELRLDSNVVIGYQKGPVREGRQIGVSVSLTSNFTGDLVVVRFKVKKGLLSLKAHASRSADPWLVALERNTGSKHDTISVICHRGGGGGSYSPGAPRQIACLSVEGLRRSFGVAMTVAAHWWVEYSGRNSHVSPHGGAVSTFSFADRDIVGIAPVTQYYSVVDNRTCKITSSTIINTAMLSSQPVSLSVIVLAVGHDGKVSDVTAAVTCRSNNEDIVKVSSDCSAIFVDGSESGVGSTCVGVQFSLGTLSGALCVSVWAPVVPFLILLSDPVLNAIEGWTYYTEAGCSPVYQRSTVQVLAQFAAQPSAQTGQLTYMLGSPDWFVDVTELVADWLKVADPRVARLDEQRNLIGLEPGATSVHVISSQWDGVLGSCDVTVTNNAVLPGDLAVQLVGGLGLSIKANPAHSSIVTATVTARNTLYSLGQEASLAIWIQFSDDTATLLSAFHAVPFSLRLSSLAESVVVVTPAPPQRVVARGDGGGPLLKAELLVSACQPTSNGVGGNGAAARRLARGSGWVRVNLDSNFQQLEGEEPEWKTKEISEVLPESTRDAYNSLGDEFALGNSSHYYNGHNMSTETELEKAVLTPNHEESGVYFSEKAEPEDEPGLSGEREADTGVGAVLSLFLLSALLFLVNCVPCALFESRSKRNGKEQTGQEDGEDGGQGVDDGQMRNRKRNKRGAASRWWGGL